ncbi:MAG: hypothetical protein U0W40_14570 [Acidimicrobiia bacterium]
MTDDARDQRDPELAAALGVPPLDDVTRRRLVRNALDAAVDATSDESGGAAEDDEAPAPAKRSWAPLAAAAVVILLVVVGIVALGRGGDDSSSDTAARKGNDDRSSAAVAPEANSSASAAGDAGTTTSFAAGVHLYGDLGDLSIPATRNAVRAELEGAHPPTGDVAESVAAEVAAASCASSLRADGMTIVGLGTATVDGQPAAVVTTRSPDGGETTSVVVFSPCSVTSL